jgi:transcriptional regulator with PAS, ATPase and Fis domain
MTTECSVTDPKNLRQVPKQLGMAAAGYPQKKRTRQEPQTFSEMKIRAIKEALSAYGNHRGKAAKRLGISQATLYRYLKKMKDLPPEGEFFPVT